MANTGNVTVTDLTVIDTLAAPATPTLDISCPDTALVPGAGTTCTATYAVTQADLDHGLIGNSAVATARGPAGQQVASDRSTATVLVGALPAVTLAKWAAPP